MEIFGRSPYLPSSTTEIVVFVCVFAAIAVVGWKAANVPTAIFLLFAAFGSYLFDSAIYIPLAILFAGLCAWRFRGNTPRFQAVVRTLREALICTTAFALYEIGRHLVQSDWAPARANADSILRFERRWGIDPEWALQQSIVHNETTMRWFNSAYSWFFLPVVAGTLFWLFIVDDRVYRSYRSSLAAACGFAVLIIWQFPLSPPRMTPGSDLVGTHAMLGGTHSYVNQFAAMPSLHVGWVALSGVALFVGVRHWIRWFWLIGPVSIMSFTVMATGHHYLVDGVVGSAIGIVPFLLLNERSKNLSVASIPMRVRQSAHRFGERLNAGAREIADVPRVKFTVYTLTLLLTYMIARQAVDPGFTHYWGYMVAQIAVTIVFVIWISVKFAPEGGFSLITHSIIVITTWADTLGTAGHMYDRYVQYDKITHFLGTAAVASAALDILSAMRSRGTLDWSPAKAAVVAMVIAVSLGIGWEIYEYYGDILFNTGRHAGAEDTIYDLISDSAGAIVAVALLLWWQSAPRSAPDHSGGMLAVDPVRKDE